jgi:hypothetical protein
MFFVGVQALMSNAGRKALEPQMNTDVFVGVQALMSDAGRRLWNHR